MGGAASIDKGRGQQTTATLQQAKQLLRYQALNAVRREGSTSKWGPAKLLSNQAFQAFLKVPLTRCGGGPAGCPAKCAELAQNLDQSIGGSRDSLLVQHRVRGPEGVLVPACAASQAAAAAAGVHAWPCVAESLSPAAMWWRICCIGDCISTRKQ